MKQLYILFFIFFSISVLAKGNINTFESIAANFKITKPDTWVFVTAQENRDNLEKLEHKDEEFKQLMLKYSSAPLVAIMKHPEPFDDLNPSLKINIKPLNNLKGVDPKKILELILPQLKNVLHDFKLDQPPMDTKIDGLNAAYARAIYSLKIPDGRVFPTTSELWVAPRGDYFFMIGAGTRQDEKTGTRTEILEILSSIELTSK